MSRRRQKQKARATRNEVLRFMPVVMVCVTLAGVALTGWRQPRVVNAAPGVPAAAGFSSLSELFAATPEQRRGLDIAKVNLLCAQGLNGAQGADGNLTTDGRWTYTWNGENRSITLETASGAVTAGQPAHPQTRVCPGQRSLVPDR